MSFNRFRPEFSSSFASEKGIEPTRYTLNASEALTQGDYYWRVRAIDAASNISPWSDPILMHAGTLSLGLFVVLVIVVVAGLAVALYFWFCFL